MPSHSLAVTLERLDGKPIDLELNEAVTMYLPRRPKSPLTDDALSVSPDAVSFRGRKWLPVEQDLVINIVRIEKACFYIKAIAFGDSKWRAPALPLLVQRMRYVRLTSNCKSVHNRRSRRQIGPFANPDHENRRPFFRVIRRHNRRARQIGSPAFRRVARNKKHQVRMPAPASIV